jgi:hypothetical protein
MTEQPHHDEGEVLKASSPGPGQIDVGMEVTSLDGERIGKVKEVGATEFLVDRAMARDLWVPFSAVMATQDYSGNVRGPVQPTAVVLNISAAHIDAQDWRHA